MDEKQTIKIHNQEKCGEKTGCPSLLDGSCRFLNINSEPCNYNAGYNSDDCALNQDVQRRIDEEDAQAKTAA